jgi:hypothetical protein
MRKRRNLPHRLNGGAFVGLLALAAGVSGCRGCKEPAPPAAAEELAVDMRRADLLARMADLKVDRSRVYPKDQFGSIRCGDDMQCFVAQAETCTPAEVTAKITDSGYGIHNVVQAVYSIVGSEQGQCKLRRKVLSATSHYERSLVAAMRADGKNELEVEQVQNETTARLRERTALHLECSFSRDDVLEAVLDLARNRFHDKLFRLGCQDSSGEVVEPTVAPAELAEAAPDAARDAAQAAPTIAPEKPAVDAPAPNKPRKPATSK